MRQCAGPPAISADGTEAATFGPDQVQSKDPTGPADGGHRLKTLSFERITNVAFTDPPKSAVSCHPRGRLFAAGPPTSARQSWLARIEGPGVARAVC
jgi:hypothetical protein